MNFEANSTDLQDKDCSAISFVSAASRPKNPVSVFTDVLTDTVAIAVKRFDNLQRRIP
ncbi:hypothetical protein [Trichocoleus sp. FACHB-262]|uniref:hypothetical protein n=1 Tax=Trichocoleus sp. FACHB-262 TaxID=2692869 RepID=UPI00168A22DD|nr:hypothetical protein [Trichocoleus sp. FACHB-262]MBD2119968.1 hypothetical protein [Trichocoleus sp. FACHB-262]